ncbi:hypothetical protein BTA51_03065 [Hahella sp. CCB-MM4]|nr:hypothetical protein BTA51_03065 [Hahella sp. CCB-MM4]
MMGSIDNGGDVSGTGVAEIDCSPLHQQFVVTANILVRILIVRVPENGLNEEDDLLSGCCAVMAQIATQLKAELQL